MARGICTKIYISILISSKTNFLQKVRRRKGSKNDNHVELVKQQNPFEGLEIFLTSFIYLTTMLCNKKQFEGLNIFEIISLIDIFEKHRDPVKTQTCPPSTCLGTMIRNLASSSTDIQASASRWVQHLIDVKVYFFFFKEYDKTI